MGLSNPISAIIIMGVFISVLFTMPGILENITSIQETSSEVNVLENSIHNTNVKIVNLEAEAGSLKVNFTLNNNGTEKLWDYENFNLLITYDADIGGIKTPVTEEFIYVDSLITADFKIQRGTAIMDATSLTDTITEGTDFDECVGPCYIELTNTRYAGATGRTAGGGNHDFDATSLYFSSIAGLTTTSGTVQVTRVGTTCDGATDCDLRWTWQIVEYIGGTGGDNEIRVHTQSTCTITTSTLTQCIGATVLTTNNADFTVLMTGTNNAVASRSDSFDNCSFVSSFAPSDRAEFTRTSADSATCNIGYAIIEWVGTNWSVDRVTHVGNSASSSNESTTDGTTTARMFILQVQQRNDAGGGDDGLGEVGERVHLSTSSNLNFNRSTHLDCIWDSDMNEVVYVISNSETTENENMIVVRGQPSDQENEVGAEEETWSQSITITRPDAEVMVTGLSTHTDSCGLEFPRGNIGAMWDATNDEVDFWQSDSGQEQAYAFEVVQFPRSEKVDPCLGDSWTIDSITNDQLHPGMLNSDESAEICAGLLYPIFLNGDITVILSTDRGIITSTATTVS